MIAVMIHSSGGMPTPNFDDPTPAEVSDAAKFQKPADYYSTPVTRPRAVPRGLVMGCGGAALLFMILMVAGGAWVSSGGFREAFDFVLSMTFSEAERYYSADVTPAQRTTLNGEFMRIRENVRSGKLPVTKLEPLLNEVRDTTDDKLLKPDEVERLTGIARQLSSLPPAKPR